MRLTRQLSSTRIVAFLGVFMLVLSTSLTPASAQIYNEPHDFSIGYNGPYPDQYSLYSGTDYGEYGQDAYGYGVYQQSTYGQWANTGVTWMRNNYQNGLFNTPNFPAVVWHTFDIFGTDNCSGKIYANGWWSTDLPGPRSITRNHNCGYNDEIRIAATDLSTSTGIQAWVGYTVRTQWQDVTWQTVTTNGEFTIDTYYLDNTGEPTSNASPPMGGRAYMQKMCWDQTKKSNPNPPKVYYAQYTHTNGTYMC